MTDPNDLPITTLLARWRSGDRSVEQPLLAAVYPALREIARGQVRRHAGVMSLQATELANEAYEKLFVEQNSEWNDREHFYAIAATVIRRVVIDHARLRCREKRGGGLQFIALDDLDEDRQPAIDDSVDWLAIDAALSDLAEFDPACARIVEMKFFSGLTAERMAKLEGCSTATVNRQWRFARSWLARRLGVAPSAAAP